MAYKTALSICACIAFAASANAHGEKTHAAKKAFVPANLQMEVKEFGRTGNPDAVSRTIEVRMSDEMKFIPDVIRVKLGETVRFVVANGGEILHEFVIGRTEDLLEHAALMQRFPEMEHAEPYMAHADEGQKAEVFWTFDKPGTFEFGCLIPGHFEAGMKGTIYVDTGTSTTAGTSGQPVQAN